MRGSGQAGKTVKISKLKAFAADELPVGSPLREIILGEETELNVDIFLARLPVWLQLSKLKNGGIAHV